MDALHSLTSKASAPAESARADSQTAGRTTASALWKWSAVTERDAGLSTLTALLSDGNCIQLGTFISRASALNAQRAVLSQLMVDSESGVFFFERRWH